MAAAIEQAKGWTVEVVPGGRGAFEVSVDGRLVFSKLDLGRFPTSEAEVLALL